MNKYKYFLVTGGAGFIGSHLVDNLLNKGAEKVVVVDNFFLGSTDNLSEAIKTNRLKIYHEDARYLAALENILEREMPEVIFDLAVKPLPYGFIDPEGAYLTSIEIAHNLAHLSRKKQFKKLVHFSSSEAYGTAQYTPMDEKHPMEPSSPYAAGKASADLLLLSFQKIFNLDISIVRPFNAYGPRQNLGTYAAVIPFTIRRILNGDNPMIEWDGEQARDFTYVTDIAEAAYNIMYCQEAIGKVVNVGQGKATTINDIIYTISDIMDFSRGKIEHKPKRPGDVRTHLASIELAEKLISYKPKIKLDEGLEKTINWYKNNYNRRE